MSILDFRMKKRISDGSIKAATEGCKPVAFAQPPSVVPGEKRKHVSDDEEEEVGEEEEEEDERNAVRDGRYYTRKLHHYTRLVTDNKIENSWRYWMITDSERVKVLGTLGTRYDIA